MLNPFEAMAARMDAATVRRMAKTAVISGVEYNAIDAASLQELGPVSGEGLSLIVFSADYSPSRSDAVTWAGKEWMVTRWQAFNGKPQIWIE